MTDCRTCGALDCINVDDYDVYSLQQPSVIAAAQSGRISLSDIDVSEGCVDEDISLTIIATGDSIDGFAEWSVLGGSLPSGLTLSPHGSYATISGTLTVPDDYIFSILVESTNGDRAAKVYSFSVNCGPGTFSGNLTGVPPNEPSPFWAPFNDYPTDVYEIYGEAGQTLNLSIITGTSHVWVWADILAPPWANLGTDQVGYIDTATSDSIVLPVTGTYKVFVTLEFVSEGPSPYYFTGIVT